MKVLVLTKKLGGSGADRQMIRMVGALLKAGEEAKLYVRKEGGPFWPAASELPLRPVPAFGALVEALKQDQPDVVYTHTTGLGQEVERARAYLDFAFRHVHGIRTHLSREWQYHPFAARLRRYRLSRLVGVVDRFHAVSEAVAKDFRRLFPAAASRTFALHNFVDGDKIQKEARAPLPSGASFPFFFSCGRLKTAKDYPTLLRAFALVAAQHREVRLIIAGAGDRKGRLQRLAQSLQIEARVTFPGFESNPYRWMARAQAFVLSSLWEGSPNVVLEAFACGTPVVATAFPGAEELVREGINGRLVPIGNAHALAQAMIALLAEGRDRLAEGAGAAAAEFTPELWGLAFRKAVFS